MSAVADHQLLDFSSMYELINEPIDVLVNFAGKRVAPQVFKWNGREYKIKQVNLIHHAREGTKRIFYFSVSDLTNYFKLRFDPEFMEWELVELYTDG